MGLGPINAIYQARFMRYLENRGIIPRTPRKVWAFLGDGETDEPESLGALTLASREKLDNLIFVVNCNLQRLDGPVRGNGKIIQELEGAFRGAGWNVIKVIWGGRWDALLGQRHRPACWSSAWAKCVDGEYQNFAVRGGAYVRKDFFGKYPELLELVADLTDDQLARLPRGGHDPVKVYNAYKRAVEHTGSPTVILAKTIKGYGMGEAGEGRNVTHQQKKLNEQELETSAAASRFRSRTRRSTRSPSTGPPRTARRCTYLRERRKAAGRLSPGARSAADPHHGPAARLLRRGAGGERGPGSLDHHGLRPRC